MSGTQLTIHISRTSVHVAEVLRSNQEIIRSKSMDLHESNPAQYKTKLSDFFGENGFNKDYEEVTAAWSTSNHALVPLRVYNDSNPKDLYHLLFGEELDQNTIDFNRLMELNMVAVFEIPDWVKSFLVIKFPRISIKHEHAFMLRATFQQSAFDKAIHISVCDDYMNVFLVHHNELKFSNTFDYQTVDDLIYYSMYVLEQQGWKDDKVKMIANYIDDSKLELLNEFTQKLKILNSSGNISVQPFKNALTIQPLCV